MIQVQIYDLKSSESKKRKEMKNNCNLSKKNNNLNKKRQNNKYIFTRRTNGK